MWLPLTATFWHVLSASHDCRSFETDRPPSAQQWGFLLPERQPPTAFTKVRRGTERRNRIKTCNFWTKIENGQKRGGKEAWGGIRENSKGDFWKFSKLNEKTNYATLENIFRQSQNESQSATKHCTGKFNGAVGETSSKRVAKKNLF